MSRSTSPLDLQELLDEAYDRFARPEFVADDPVQVPRSFPDRSDAEVIGLLTATISWGRRATIIRNAFQMARRMDDAPHDFILHANAAELTRLNGFVHRTFNATDLRYFVRALRHLYRTHGDIEGAFLENDRLGNMNEAIARFRSRFFRPAHPPRTRKHVADPSRGSNAKRINMFLRWMVRPDDRGVDLGLWKRIHTRDLMVPLDVHTGRVARALGLLRRTQDDRRSVEELTAALRAFDGEDPVRYDIALFGLGVTAQGHRAKSTRVAAR
ncbi:MAG: TIGR02757 family protein [Flavobacteriales bacterium]|nr:TIGR02757 family protein [Flavobacteriales bacterium]MCB9168608.1 TIGR02757 family protein [Flavobacteriales bacterium]